MILFYLPVVASLTLILLNAAWRSSTFWVLNDIFIVLDIISCFFINLVLFRLCRFIFEVFTLAQVRQRNSCRRVTDYVRLRLASGCIFEILGGFLTWGSCMEMGCVIHQHHLLLFMLLYLYIDNWLLIGASLTKSPDIINSLCLDHLLLMSL